MPRGDLTHDIELVHPLYANPGVHSVVCICGWASDELPTPGKATIAGWAHIRAETREQPAGQPTRGSEQPEGASR